MYYRSLSFLTCFAGSACNVPVVPSRDAHSTFGVTSPTAMNYHSPQGQIDTLGESTGSYNDSIALLTEVGLDCRLYGVRELAVMDRNPEPKKIRDLMVCP